ncbi:inositol monophosphatase family protein [Candidatus Thiodictyon syntrophicum]|uniref:inositol monophosphatase family protein n=1 Tax=Candidatus Thiodictyon syntrophicum TaxID=1166950 RepID=UPI0012FE076C|nr:inositol monophosphatase family protein [Candidatus Thiodictyon syntrophicum]
MKRSPADIDLDQVSNAAARIASEAGALIISRFGYLSEPTPKGNFDVQLDIDIQSEELIISLLTDQYPSIPVISEEMTAKPNWAQDTVWIVDPLDGTNNFAVGIPYIAVSICLRSRQRLLVGVIHDPITSHTYVARLSAGATCDGNRLHLDAAKSMQAATVSLVTGYSISDRKMGETAYLALSRRARRVVTMWAPAADLARIADGQLDAMVCFNALFGDVCSGLLLISEAGGVITNLDGAEMNIHEINPDLPVTFVASGNYILCAEILSAIRDIR